MCKTFYSCQDCDVENIVTDSCENDGYEISHVAENNRTIQVDTSKINEDDYRLKFNLW